MTTKFVSVTTSYNYVFDGKHTKEQTQVVVNKNGKIYRKKQVKVDGKKVMPASLKSKSKK